MISYYKNKFIDTNIPINENLLYGIGMFETIKFIDNGILFFDEHLDRLFSNSFFNFSKLDKNEIYNNAKKLISKNSLNKGVIKIIVVPLENDWNQLEYYILIRELPKISSDKVKVIFYSEDEYPILRFNPLYKSLFYMGNIAAQKKAKLSGAFEPIFFNNNKLITEGAMRNIFFIKNNIVYTPPLDLGILNGITRQHIIKLVLKLGYKCIEKNIIFNKIHEMEEAFITSTGIGVLPCYWENWTSNFSITFKLKNLYNANIKIK